MTLTETIMKRLDDEREASAIKLEKARINVDKARAEYEKAYETQFATTKYERYDELKYQSFYAKAVLNVYDREFRYAKGYFDAVEYIRGRIQNDLKIHSAIYDTHEFYFCTKECS